MIQFINETNGYIYHTELSCNFTELLNETCSIVTVQFKIIENDLFWMEKPRKNFGNIV